MEPCYPLPSASPTTWENIKSILLHPIPNLDSLITTIHQLSGDQNSREFPSLRKFFGFHQTPEQYGIFFEVVLPIMVRVGLAMPTLYGDGFLPRLCSGVEGKVMFTREQVACLVVHMFFCTLPKMEFNLFWTNYRVLYESDLDPVIVYLHVIIRYFWKYSENHIPPQQKITIYRRVQKEDVNWRESDKQLIPINIQLTGEIGECPGMLEVWFANKDIGFGRGGTQEEICFGMSPEAGIVVLLVDTMADNEAILIHGITKIGKHKDYGLDVKYVGDADQWEWDKRWIVCMDALPFPEPDPFEKFPEMVKLKNQIQPPYLHRELTKVYCSLQPETDPNLNFPNIVSTGGWGCGSFSGNQELKFLIQWIAASQAGMGQITYYTFGEEQFTKQVKGFVEGVIQQRWTVGRVYLMLENIQGGLNNKLSLYKNSDSLFNILKKIGSI